MQLCEHVDLFFSTFFWGIISLATSAKLWEAPVQLPSIQNQLNVSPNTSVPARQLDLSAVKTRTKPSWWATTCGCLGCRVSSFCVGQNLPQTSNAERTSNPMAKGQQQSKGSHSCFGCFDNWYLLVFFRKCFPISPWFRPSLMAYLNSWAQDEGLGRVKDVASWHGDGSFDLDLKTWQPRRRISQFNSVCASPLWIVVWRVCGVSTFFEHWRSSEVSHKSSYCKEQECCGNKSLSPFPPEILRNEFKSRSVSHVFVGYSRIAILNFSNIKY